MRIKKKVAARALLHVCVTSSHVCDIGTGKTILLKYHGKFGESSPWRMLSGMELT
jgi:hypothetical protein